MPTAYEKLSALLKECFQLDQADLDFGIYRIMNQKRGEITRFLDHELLPQVKAAFDLYRPADKKVIEGELQKAIQGAQALGMDPDLVPKVKEIREQLATYAVDTGALENEVYSHLYSFFRRYYDNGDFISMRRYKEGVYAIPYEGEEVKLHWANADQYYVKTTENFRDYAFRLTSGRLAHFKVVEAETEKDNRKAAEDKERRFLLADEEAIKVENDALVMRFEYRADPEKREQKVINALAVEAILANAPAEWSADIKTLAPSESNPRRMLLEKHLADYTTRNTFDYFIHKDLRGFLRRELDFYIKNEVMRLDDVESETAQRVEQYLSKIKALRQIAHKIIAFLAQIEDFQKKLWLKKKFVVETNYCITLDRVPEELYPAICANDAQREEWVRLFAIDDIKGNLLKPGYSTPLTIEFLKTNPNLVLDTTFFDEAVSNQILDNIENLEDNLNGLLIHSDNFQAIQLLQRRYEAQIKCIYIDPPEGSRSQMTDYAKTE
jgi:adenine-specific DNA-methyltransferase